MITSMSRSGPGGVADPRPVDSPAPFLGSFVALILAFLVPIIITLMTPEGTSRDEWGIISTCILAGLVLGHLTASRQRRPFEMVAWVFFYVFLGIAPMVQVRMDVDPSTTLGIHHSLYGSASFIVLLAALFTLAGSVAASGTADGPGDRAEEGFRSSAARTYFLSFVALGLFAYYVSKIGLSSLFVSRNELAVIRDMVWPDRTTNAVIGAGSSMGLLVSMIALVHLRHQQKREGQSRAFFLPLIVFVALVACVNPISTPRYVFGTALLALLAAVGLHKTLGRFRVVTMSFVAGLVFVFPGLDAFRNSVTNATVKSSDALTSLTTGDFDAFAQVVNTVEYVQRNGLTNGNQLMGVVFFWVPRSVWPDKAVDTGTLLANMKGYLFTNLSAPLPAELFINGGWAALVVGMMLFGFAIRRWDVRLNHLIQHGVAPSILGCIMPFYLLILLRGSLLQAVAFMAVIFVSAVFVAPRKNHPKLISSVQRDGRDAGLVYASDISGNGK